MNIPTVQTVMCMTCDATPPTVVVSQDRYPVPDAPAGVDPEALGALFQATCLCRRCHRVWAQVFSPTPV